MGNVNEQKAKLRGMAFSLYCKSLLQERGADALVNRWQRVDELAKIAVALTATGSAVSGWALWTKGQGTWAWAVIAGAAATLAIIHTALGVAGRVRDWGRLKHHFMNLRYDLESFATRMALDEELSIDEWRRQLMICRERYKQGLGLVPNDIFYTSRLGERMDQRLARELRKEPDGTHQDMPVWRGIHIFGVDLAAEEAILQAAWAAGGASAGRYVPVAVVSAYRPARADAAAPARSEAPR